MSISKSKKIVLIIILVVLVAILFLQSVLYTRYPIGHGVDHGIDTVGSVIDLNNIEKYGSDCRIERACNYLVGVDCGAAYDGGYYYVKKNGEVVSLCGGYCMGGRCTNCPPKEWTCPTY